MRVHPRVGGGDHHRGRHRPNRKGSSPRGRGRLPLPARFDFDERFIPAWAGETARAAECRHGRWVHPRVGGGDPHNVAFPFFQRGSSPRGRGRPVKVQTVVDYNGFIPAWAGETAAVMNVVSSPRVHPRVGGGDTFGRLVVNDGKGSSPRGRGRPRGAASRRRGQGFIPAWAGETSASSWI